MSPPLRAENGAGPLVAVELPPGVAMAFDAPGVALPPLSKFQKYMLIFFFFFFFLNTGERI
jgi:hypothetical protein